MRLNSQSSLAMTLSAWRRYSFDCRYRLGTASNLAMYVSAADNDYVGVTGTFLGTAAQGVWSTAGLDFSAPPGGVAKLHFGASMQIRASAFEGESVSVTDLLADLLALTGSARTDRTGQRGLRPAAAQRRELHGRVHHGRGRLGRSLLRSAHSHRHRRRSHAVVHRRRVGQLAEHHRGGQRGPAELGTINNTATSPRWATCPRAR